MFVWTPSSGVCERWGEDIELHQIEEIHSHYIEGFSILPNLMKVLFVCSGAPQHICKMWQAYLSSSTKAVTVKHFVSQSVISLSAFLHHIRQSCCSETSRQPSVSGWLKPVLTTLNNGDCQNENWVWLSHKGNKIFHPKIYLFGIFWDDCSVRP